MLIYFYDNNNNNNDNRSCFSFYIFDSHFTPMADLMNAKAL